MAAVLGMPVAFVLAGACTLAGAVILAVPPRRFAGATAAADGAAPEQI
jgi:hypothetical protein